MIKTLEDLIAANELSVWLTAIGVAVGLFLLLSLAKKYIVRMVATAAAPTSSEIKALIIAVLGKTGELFFFLVSLFAGASFLSLGTQATLVLDAVLVLDSLFQVGLWGNARSRAQPTDQS